MQNQSDTSYKPNLNQGTTYYWMIIPWDIHNASNTSEIWSFSTIKYYYGGGNQRPNANDDSEFTNINTTIWIDVLANDNDIDGFLDPSTMDITYGPSHGKTLINTTTGEIKYTPDTNYYGSDSFDYKVKDKQGALSNTATVTITVGGVKADASASSPYYGFVGQEIIFNGSFSFDPDPDGYIVDWFWDFGDGTNGTGEITTHIYSMIGNYSASLTVTDNESYTDKDIFNVLILIPNNPPTKPTITGPILGHKNITYNFTALSTDLDNDSIQYIINWGDGESLTTEFLPNGTSTHQSHNWQNYGKYIISVIAFDNKTDSETAEFIILIDVIPLDSINGLLIDLNSDEEYDVFNNTETGKQTDLKKENNTYLIDSNGDGKCDHTYNFTVGLLTYYEYVYQKFYPMVIKDLQTYEAPGFEFITLLAAIVILFVVFRRRR